MTHLDSEHLVTDTSDARLTHDGLSHSGVHVANPIVAKLSWVHVVLGTAVVAASVGVAIYWVSARSVVAGSPESTVQQSRAALEPLAEGVVPEPALQFEPPAAGNHVVLEAVEFRPVTEQRPSVSFTEPLEGSTVGSTLQVQGMVQNVSDAKHLWLVTRRDAGGIWPKERIEPSSEGRFKLQIWDFGDNGPLSICLLATDATDTRRFNDWLLVGDRDDIWPALAEDHSRSNMLGCLEVKFNRRFDR
jgi:hypothetical protein